MGVVMKRLTVFMSADLLCELTATAKHYGVRESEFVRGLIIEQMREDRIASARLLRGEEKDTSSKV